MSLQDRYTAARPNSSGRGAASSGQPAAYSDQDRYLDVDIDSDGPTYHAEDEEYTWGSQDPDYAARGTGRGRKPSDSADRWAPVADSSGQDDWD